MQQLKRISVEEAKPYLSTKDDFLGSDPAFFTLELDTDGWEKVTYFTTRKKLE